MSAEGEARVIKLLEQILSTLQRERDPEPSALLDGPALAAELGVSIRTLRRMREDKNFPKPVCINGSIRWKRVDVDRHMRARKS